MTKLPFAIQLACDTPDKVRIIYRQIGLPRQLNTILEQLRKDPHAHIFLTKVNKRDAPDYYDVIKQPMDLGLVGRKVGMYRSIAEFKKDLDLIWSNCLAYNTAEYFINCAMHMKELSDKLINLRTTIHPGLLTSLDRNLNNTEEGKRMLHGFIGKFLKGVGLGVSHASILNALADALEYKIYQIIKDCK